MSNCRQRDGLFWPSLFLIPDEKRIKQTIKWLKDCHADYDGKNFMFYMLKATAMPETRKYRPDDACMAKACEIVALKFMLDDTDFAKNMLDDDEYEKARSVYARKQYNSKILQQLLTYFLLLLSQSNCEKLNNLFTIALLDEFHKIHEEETNKIFSALKKTIEKIASGVKSSCYTRTEQSPLQYQKPLEPALNDFVASSFNYNFNDVQITRVNNQTSTLFCNHEYIETNTILQKALLDNHDFWMSHKNFDVVTFINEVCEQNDARHAEKLLTHIFANLKKFPNMDIVFNHGFPLYMSMYDELVVALEDQARRFGFKRLERYCDISPIANAPLCYPMRKAEPSQIALGKAVWNNFICKHTYPSESDIVTQYLNDEVDKFVSGETRTDTDIAVILDSAPFRYSAANQDRRLFAAYHPDCFSGDNIWKRVYLKAYAVTLLSDSEDVQFSYLQRIFVDLIKVIEQRIGVCTKHQLDMSVRTKNYTALKERLKEYNINVRDEYRINYIVALLDRDTALMEEAELFPVLEQLGDAVYGLAVAELLFYNPETENMAKSFEDYTRAEAQVLISHKVGFNKLYLQVGPPEKYPEFDSIFYNYESFVMDEERKQTLNKEKYLADSVEMIIGAICKDQGIEIAINFTKTLLKKTFPKVFYAEILPTEENKYNKDIEMDYWTRILPAPCSVMDAELSTLWRALDRVLLTVSLDTDDKGKRNYITHSFGNTAIYGESYNYGVTWVFYEYLCNGITSVLQKYGDTIRENYHNNKII